MFYRSFWFYTIIISIALAALLFVQFSWIYTTLINSDEAFKKDMNIRLESIVEKIEEDQLCFEFLGEVNIEPGDDFFLMIPKDDRLDTLALHYWSNYGEDTLYSAKNLSFSVPALAQFEIKFEYLLNKSWREMENLTELESQILEQYETAISYSKYNAELKLIDTSLLRSLMKNEMVYYGEVYDFDYGVYDNEKEEFLFISSGSNAQKLLNSKIKSIIFKDSKFYQPYTLSIFFPNKEMLLIKSEFLMLFGSLSLMILLVLLFILFVRAVINQRNLAQMKVDFINNMTHEFSTPVSNISLAINSLEQKKFTDDLNQGNLIEIIKEENYRLKQNVNSLLNTSKIGENGFEIDRSRIDLHKVIEKVVEVFKSTHKDKELRIACDLSAENSLVNVDRAHIANVLHNLLDNAYKYSNELVEIEVITKNKKQGLELTIKDQGIGIKKTDLELIYDQFYRIDNSNRHNVKGFGLGLCYVKTIMDAHGGKLSVNSDYGKGTSFQLFLPQE